MNSYVLYWINKEMWAAISSGSVEQRIVKDSCKDLLTGLRAKLEQDSHPAYNLVELIMEGFNENLGMTPSALAIIEAAHSDIKILLEEYINYKFHFQLDYQMLDIVKEDLFFLYDEDYDEFVKDYQNYLIEMHFKQEYQEVYSEATYI